MWCTFPFPTSRQLQSFKAPVVHFTSNVYLILLHKIKAIIWLRGTTEGSRRVHLPFWMSLNASAVTASAASPCAVLYFICTGSDPSHFLFATLFFNTDFAFPPPPPFPIEDKFIRNMTTLVAHPALQGKRNYIFFFFFLLGASECDSPSESALWKHSGWGQICFHWWRTNKEGHCCASCCVDWAERQ